MKAERPLSGGVHEALPHDSAALHVAGAARYIDDLPEPPGTLFAGIVTSRQPYEALAALNTLEYMWKAGHVPLARVQEIQPLWAYYLVSDEFYDALARALPPTN